MIKVRPVEKLLRLTGGFFAILSLSVLAALQSPEELLERLDDYPHAQQMDFSETEVIDHEIGLGAMQKVRGDWRLKDSERLSGTLISSTWQIVDGFTSNEVMTELLSSVVGEEGVSELYACDGRACGKGVQWANRVFGQRVLYGREADQRYRVYAVQTDTDTRYRLVIFSAARTTDRQYLQVEVLRIAD